MTLAEYLAWVKAWNWRDKQEWLKIAQLGCFILSPWSKTVPTPERLMGAEFFAEITTKKFKTEEEWEKHKAGIKRMANYFADHYKKILAGKKKPIKMIHFEKKPASRSK